MALAAGSTFGAFRVVEPLGQGGMATVYKAYESALDRYVALKVLPAELLQEPTFAERFRRKARVVARLEHPNIIPIYAFGIEGAVPWMAMRLIRGGSLSALLKQGLRLPPGDSLAILRGVAAALDHAHLNAVVHRDIKPQNILLDEARDIYLTDFGIARIVEGSPGLTKTGVITGTPQYMAPEQATGKPVDSRADIYALGIVAYELLTGRAPFRADTPVAVLMKHISEPIPIPQVSEVPEPATRSLLLAPRGPSEAASRPGPVAASPSPGSRAVASLFPSGQPLETAGSPSPAAPGVTPAGPEATRPAPPPSSSEEPRRRRSATPPAAGSVPRRATGSTSSSPPRASTEDVSPSAPEARPAEVPVAVAPSVSRVVGTSEEEAEASPPAEPLKPGEITLQTWVSRFPPHLAPGRGRSCLAGSSISSAGGSGPLPCAPCSFA